MKKDSHKLNKQWKMKKMQTKTNSPSDPNKNKTIYVCVIVNLWIILTSKLQHLKYPNLVWHPDMHFAKLHEHWSYHLHICTILPTHLAMACSYKKNCIVKNVGSRI